MATTDRDVLTRIQYLLIETPNGGVTVSSGLWTTAEFIDAINTAQEWVLREARPLFRRVTLNTIPNQPRYALPQDWLMTRRVAWEKASGVFTDLPRDSAWSADQLESAWTYDFAPQPVVYTDAETPEPSLQVMPASSDNGLLHITYVPDPNNLSNTGVLWTIPDVLIPMAMWKAVAILLAKDGRGQDLPRADLAHKRALEGLSAVQLMLNGWGAR